MSQGLGIQTLRCHMKKYRILKEEEELDFFTQYEGVVFGVLKRLNIFLFNPDYDEYAQIGRIHLVKAYEEFPGDPWDEQESEKFVSYAFTKIRWKIVDNMRQNARRQEKELKWEDLYDNTLPHPMKHLSEIILEKEWLEEVLAYLESPEKRLVVDVCIHRMSITDIAKKEKVSRKTIYTRRKKVQEKLAHKYYPHKGE